MIRQMLVSVARKRSTITLRHFATGTTTAQKRALNKLQIDAHPDPVTPPPATPPPVSEGGDSSGLVLPALGAITVIAGVAYYFDVFGINKEFETTPATIKEETKEIKEDPVYEVKKEGILNNIELRYNNEPARHKLLDVLGDLALIGTRIKGKVIRTNHLKHPTHAKFGLMSTLLR